MRYNIYLYDTPNMGLWYTKKEVACLIASGRKLYYDKQCTKLATTENLF